MKKLISGILAILLAATLVPSTSQARYLNPNTGRFQTMDTYEGSQKDPLSLHQYLYCRVDPVDSTDPSGHESIGSVLVSISISGFLFAQITPAAAVKSTGLHYHAVGTTEGLVERLLAAEVIQPGEKIYEPSNAESGLWMVGAVVVNRVKNKGNRFPKTITEVIKSGEFAHFQNYYHGLPAWMKRNIDELEKFANQKGAGVMKYKRHMEELLYVAQRVIRLDEWLDILYPAGSNEPTLYFRQHNHENPWFDGKYTKVPEYRGTFGGNDFYRERRK